MALEKLQVNINADTAGFDKGLKSVKSGLSGLRGEAQKTNTGLSTVSKGFKSALKAGIAFLGIQAGLKGVADSFKSFISFESSILRINDLFGDSSKYIRYFGEHSAKALGMAESSVYQYAAIYGNLFKSITKDAEENSKVTIAMLKASAVTASKTGRTMDDVMDRIRSGMLGNTEAIEDLGIQVNVAMLESTDAFKRIANGRSWEQLSFYEQQQIRALAILEQVHKNFGDEVQKGSAYSISVLSESFKDLKTYIGQFINTGLQPLIKGLTIVVQKATEGLKALSAMFGLKIDTAQSAKDTEKQATAQQKLTNEIKETAKAKGKLAAFDEINVITTSSPKADSALASSTGSVFDSIPAPEYEITEPDTSWIDGIKTKLSGLSDFVTKILGRFSPSINAWSDALSKLRGPASKAFTNIKNSVSNVWNNTLAPFGNYLTADFIPSVVNGFNETFAPIFAAVLPVLLEEFALNFEFMCQQISRAINDIYLPVMDLMKIISLDVFAGIKLAWDNHGTGILEKFKKFEESLRVLWSSIYENVIKPISTNIANTVEWLWDKHLKKLWDNITEFLGAITEYALTMWNKYIMPLVRFIVEKFVPPIVFALKIIGDIIGTVFALIVDIVSGIIQALSGLANFITGVFTGDWKKAWNGVKQIFTGIWESIWGVIKGIINSIIDGLNLVWGGIYTLAKGVVDSIGGIAGAIGKIFGKDWKFSLPAEIPSIPKLAGGALAYGEVVSIVGDNFNARQDPEVISPLSGLKKMIVEALQSGAPQYAYAAAGDVYVQIGDEQLDAVVTRSEKSRSIKSNGR